MNTKLTDDFDTMLGCTVRLINRVKALRALRAKEGRVLSSANREKIIANADALQALVDELDLLLDLDEALRKQAA